MLDGVLKLNVFITLLGLNKANLTRLMHESPSRYQQSRKSQRMIRQPRLFTTTAAVNSRPIHYKGFASVQPLLARTGLSLEVAKLKTALGIVSTELKISGTSSVAS